LFLDFLRSHSLDQEDNPDAAYEQDSRDGGDKPLERRGRFGVETRQGARCGRFRI